MVFRMRAHEVNRISFKNAGAAYPGPFKSENSVLHPVIAAA